MNKYILGLLLLILLACPLLAARKALVIGNSTYPTLPLKNPVNDARAMATTLRELGFEVTVGYNVKDLREMLRMIQDFSAGLEAINEEEESVGLFYYAGQAIQANGYNYLIPTEAKISKEQDVKIEGLDLNHVLRGMGSAKIGVSLIFMDACLNNPYTSDPRSKAGLAATTTKIPGMLIAYATAPGGVVQEGTENGVYTEELLKNIKTPDLSLHQILLKTREGVIARTDGEQIPWENSSLTRDFYFARTSGLVQITQQQQEAKEQTVGDCGSIVVSVSQTAYVFLDGNHKAMISEGTELKIKNVPVGRHSLKVQSSEKSETKSLYVEKDHEIKVHFEH